MITFNLHVWVGVFRRSVLIGQLLLGPPSGYAGPSFQLSLSMLSFLFTFDDLIDEALVVQVSRLKVLREQMEIHASLLSPEVAIEPLLVRAPVFLPFGGALVLIVSEDMRGDGEVEKGEEAMMQTEDVDGIVCIKIVAPFEVSEGPRVLLREFFSNVLPVPLDGGVAGTLTPYEWGSDSVYTDTSRLGQPGQNERLARR
jgi:hypothetical protein